MTMTLAVKPSTEDSGGIRGFLPIACQTLLPTDQLDFDLYVVTDEETPVLFRGRDYPLEEADIDRLQRSETRTLYIRLGDQELYRDYLRDVVLSSPELDEGARFRVLTEVHRSVFSTAFRSPDINRFMKCATEFGNELTSFVCASQLGMTDLISLMSHDYYTFTHVANVTTYCVCLAARLGVRDRDELQKIAVGGLIHDFGKRNTAAAILNFPGKLDPIQFREIRLHPHNGFCLLSHRKELTWGQLMMAYQHHERPDGQGYPVGSRGDEIHLWARICKVADVFDALLCQRPYHRARSTEEVLELMGTKMKGEFDEEIFTCFRAMIDCRI